MDNYSVYVVFLALAVVLLDRILPEKLGRGSEEQSHIISKGSSSSVPSRAPTTYYKSVENRVGRVDTGSLLFDRNRHTIAMVTDLDLHSRDPEKFLWRSFMKKATLVKVRPDRYRLEWDKEVKVLKSKTATSNRSMELSALLRYRHWLFGMCDYTGLIFKIVEQDGEVFQRWAIADGDGNAAKPFKMEWATVKDDEMWVGGTGKPWTNKDGQVVHKRPLWVKTINSEGRIFNINWEDVYLSLRTATNTTDPGYLWHEAVHWDPRSRQWILLPRKHSLTAYWPDDDERRGTNLLIIASEDFSSINVKRIGPLEPEYGFTAVRKVPGTDGIFLALKAKEVGEVTHTKIAMFDLNGTMYFDPPFLEVGDQKFEGLEFLSS
jgi:soluble calcium-activated nucleotidase 1